MAMDERNAEVKLPLFPAAAGSLFPISVRSQAQVHTPDSAQHWKQGQQQAAGPSAATWLSNTSFSQSLLPPPRPPPPAQNVGQVQSPVEVDEHVSDAKKRKQVKEDEDRHAEESKRKEKKRSKGDEDKHGDVSDEESRRKEGKRKKAKEKEERHSKKHKKQEAKQRAEDSVIGNLKNSRSERKAAADIWLSDSGWQKEYYFDSRGDRDNLAFESLYRYDVARYHPHHSKEIVDAGKLWGRTVGLLNPESDSCSQDESLRSGGRYWSSKAAALERRRDYKRMLLAAGQEPEAMQPDMSASFVPLDGEEKPREECWEDYVLNRTREFSQKTHDEPQNESMWISFVNFQDEIIQAEKRKTMVQHAIDKKILLLERALEFHPDSERLLLLYLETSKRRDDLSTLLSKWERIIMKHSGSYRLWWQYLRLRRSTFSKFSVSAVRKLYSQALQALAAARTRQQMENDKRRKGDDGSSLLEAELGLVTVFLDLCRFEWQSGHHELAIGLLQAQFEFSVLCPLVQLSQNNKLRLFEEFWNSGAPRIGETEATGWSTWMQQQEEQIQKAKAMTSYKVEDDSGWRGWKEPSIVDDETKVAEPSEEVLDADDNEDLNVDESIQEDDAALLEKLGLNLDLAKDAEVKDARIWKRWSEEEIQRDSAQWLPVKPTAGRSRAGIDDNDDPELEDDGLEKMVMFDDVRENLFSLTTEQARLHLLGQFLEFCNAPLFQWCCSNVRGYREKFESLDGLTSDLYTAVSGDQSWGDIISPMDWIKESTGRVSFVRNAVLLLRDALMHKLHFQEVLISLEAMEASEREESGDGSNASRALAKKLLKANRQDLTLWAAYACFEASTGDVKTARKVFDTALSSLSALPKDAQTDAPVIYLAYAEVEMAQCATSSQDFRRVLYILHFLGVSEPYQPGDSTLSKTQLLKTLRGYQDQLQKLYRLGNLTEGGASLVICAALFQQLTAGWEAATSIFEQSLANLPDNQQNVHMERLLHCYIAMLESQKSWVKPTTVRRVVKQGVEQYPLNFKLLSSYRHASLISDTRRFIDYLAQRNPSSVLWLFALSCELTRPGAISRIHNVFERALETEGSQQSVLIWRLYIAYELKLNNLEGVRRVFFRAIHACPWSKALWMDGFQKLNTLLSVKELSDLVDIMRDKELRIRTDVYEILLEEVA